MTEAGSTPVASVRSVEKTFGERAGSVRALCSVDLDVGRGEVLLLMGPSCSGKTTLLSILGCILKPSRGEVIVCGLPAAAMTPRELAHIRLRSIGFVFQDFNLLPALSSVENVEIPILLAGGRPKQARRAALEALDSVGLNGKAHARPEDLSGGEKQRVAICRALANSPDLVLADEPTASLDSVNGRAILRLLSSLGARNNCGVVIVSHDPRAREFANRVVYLEDGKIAPHPGWDVDVNRAASH